MRNVCKLTGIAAALFIAASVPFAWCGAQSQSAGKESAGKDSGVVTVTDLAGRQVTLKLPVKKVNVNWSGSGGAFMTMSALLGTEVADYLSSWDGQLEEFYSDRWQEYSSKVPALKNIPVIGSVDTENFNLERLIALQPDAVIWTLEVREQAKSVVEPTLASVGIPIIYIDHHAETIENHTKTTQILGKLFGKEKQADEIVKWYTDSMNMINNRLAKVTSKPLVYVERAVEGPSTYGNSYGDDMMWGAVVVNAGGRNIASGIIKTWAPLQPELILSKNPDDIVLTGSYRPNNSSALQMGYLSNENDVNARLASFANRPGWTELAATKNKRIYAIYHGLGREIYDVVALAFLAKAFHPDIFADVDPMGMFRDYFKRFLPYDLYGVWMTQLK